MSKRRKKIPDSRDAPHWKFWVANHRKITVQARTSSGNRVDVVVSCKLMLRTGGRITGSLLSGTMVFKRIRRFKIQFLNPKLPPTPQIFLHSETDISRIDEYQKFGRKRMQDYNLISSSLATSQHF